MSSGSIALADLQKAIADFKDPETGLAAAGQKQIRDLAVSGTTASLTLALSTHSAPLWQRDAAAAGRLCPRPAAWSHRGENQSGRCMSGRHNKLGQVGLTAKSVIAVGSGKGGVGKSTIAAALALGLKRAGSKVGLLDTDVYGPSIPHLLGLENAPPPAVVEGKVPPVLFDGMPVMSMGFLLPPGKAVVWRGPMLHSYVTQFLRDVAWGDLDYLIIDMPPGTGDIALSLSQVLPVTGAVIVCTPQEVALLDAVRAISMFRTVNIPILGIVENMSGFMCENCGKRYDIFGSGGARAKGRGAERAVPGRGAAQHADPHVRRRGPAAGELRKSHRRPAPWKKSSAALVRNLAQSAAAQPPMMQLPVLK